MDDRRNGTVMVARALLALGVLVAGFGCEAAGGAGGQAAEPDAVSGPTLQDASGDARASGDTSVGETGPDVAESDDAGSGDAPGALCVPLDGVCEPGAGTCCEGSCVEYTIYDYPRCREHEPPPPPSGDDWCGPGARPPLIDVARGAADWYRPLEEAGCGLVRIERDLDGDGAVDETEEIAGGDGGLVFAHVWTGPNWMNRGPAEVWIGVASGQRDEHGGLRLAVDTQRQQHNALQRAVRVYDPEDRLRREEHWWNGSLWFELDLEWAGGRLVRVTHTDRVNDSAGPRTTVYEWRWDPATGLLEEAQVVSPGAEVPEQRVRWTYDEGGRPTRAERQMAGLPWLTQTWEYDAEGRLVAREVEQPLGGSGWPLYVLDDLSPWAVRDVYQSYDWSDSLPRPTASGCYLPPSSAAHGYPSAEKVYEMGWPVAERPHGIGFDYGYSGYAYYYGDAAWFGHGGVGGGDEVLTYGDATRVRVTYDAEARAVREDVEIRFTDGTDRDAMRSRRFESGRIVEDERRLTLGEATHATAFTFRYDETGRLAARDYAMDAILVARHTWDYDAATGGIAAHGIAHHGGAYASFIGQEWAWIGEFPDLAALEGDPVLWWVHERSYEDDGRRVILSRRSVRDGGVQPYGSLEHDDEGRLTLWAMDGGRQLLAYDDYGRLRFSGVDANGDGDPERFLSWESDQDGRLLTVETFDANAGSRLVERYVYCAPGRR